MAKSRVTFTKDYYLPMKGLTEKPEGFVQFPKIQLRAMTTMEEKTRLSGNGYSAITNLLKSCITTEGIDVDNMNTVDIQYLIYMLRSLTYGSKYTVSVRCPACGKINKIEVNLDDLPLNEVDDDFTGICELEQLPVSKDIITCKIETSKDLELTERESARILRKFPDYVGDPEMIIKWCHRITAINGNKVTSNDVQRYIESMHALDYQFLDSKYNKFVSNYGVDTLISVTCEDCGEDFESAMPMNSEFFRPRY